VAVLDDQDARRFALAIGITLVGTIGILQACVRDGQLSGDEAWKLLQSMIEKGFRAPPSVEPSWFTEA
jgi:pentatricopeptide repeat protein